MCENGIRGLKLTDIEHFHLYLFILHICLSNDPSNKQTQKENHVISVRVISGSRLVLVSSPDLVNSRPDLTGRILPILNHFYLSLYAVAILGERTNL